MATGKSQRIAELIGFIGVIGSLVFVGLEVRQSTIATQASTDAAVAESFLQLNMVMAASPELARALAEHAGNPDAAPAEDKIHILGLYRGVFHIWSNAHRQHLNGTIDPVLYESIVQELSAYAGEMPAGANVSDVRRRQKLTRWAWKSERFLYNRDFQQFVDAALAAHSGDENASD